MHTQFVFVVVRCTVFSALVPLHRETLADFRDYLCETLYSKMNARMKYWSTIAKTIHYWRDRHNAMYTDWVQAFSVVEADKHAKKISPQPISGRWGISKAARRGTVDQQRGQRASERATHQP